MSDSNQNFNFFPEGSKADEFLRDIVKNFPNAWGSVDENDNLRTLFNIVKSFGEIKIMLWIKTIGESEYFYKGFITSSLLSLDDWFLEFKIRWVDSNIEPESLTFKYKSLTEMKVSLDETVLSDFRLQVLKD